MKLNRIRVVLTALALLPFVAGCSGSSSGGESPTAPPPMSSAAGSGSATIGGSVSTGGSASAAGSVTAADESGAGVVVSIQGTGISATADAQGRFRLNGVPDGNQLLLFDHGGGAASLLVEGIQQQEAIDLDVTVDGSSVQVNSMTRNGGSEDEPETLDPAALSLQVSPDSWNLNYDRAQGTVEAFLRGDGFTLVDLASIAMEGDGTGGPLAARSATAEGNHVHARFAKNQVLGLLADPAPGSVHTVIVTFMEQGGSERFALEAVVRIVGEEEDDGEDDDGEDDDGEDDEPIALTLDVQPSSWNTNWLRSNGTVSALLRGSGFERVDLGSIVLVGTDPAAGELAPERADAQGNHVRAFFGQSDAFLTLLDGDTGQTHVITIRFTVEGAPMELTATIRTVGPAL